MELGHIVIFGGLMALGLWLTRGASKERELRNILLRGLGTRFGGGVDENARRAFGQIAGANISFQFAVRGSGKHAQRWTEIDAEVPAKYPLAMLVRKHAWLDQGKIDRGEMVDVIVGDEAFDNRFLVEAAPADVARVLLDERARGYLMTVSEQRLVEITTQRPEGGDPVLRFACYGWIEDPTEASTAIEMITSITGRVRAAYAAVETAVEERDEGNPYRPMLDDTRAKRDADDRLEEVKRVDKIQTDRKARDQAFLVGFVIVAILVGIFLTAAGK
jgi:hypothetical protein